MTTSEFIKILQEADPKGTAHIRMEGGIPHFAERKPGYWDGAYSYIDEDNNYVTSTEGDKIDIHCIDISIHVESLMSKHKDLEDIKKKFVFNIGSNQDRVDRVMKEVESAYKDFKEMDDEMYERQLEEAIKKADEGHRWFQNKEVDNIPEGEMNNHIYYTWKFMSPTGEVENHSTPWKTQPILQSELWTRVDNGEMEGYYEWIWQPIKVEIKDRDDSSVYNAMKYWFDRFTKDDK
jgi:hypothetical protein